MDDLRQACYPQNRMPSFKHIEVCCGKACGPAGSAKIKEQLMRSYAVSGVEIVECGCTGRCEHCCTIVVDGIAVSDLTPSNLKDVFLNDPDQAIASAQEQDTQSTSLLDDALEKLF